MASPNILALVGAVAIAAVVGAVGEASNRQSGKSERQCRHEATSLGWNNRDEADQWGYNQYLAKCQYGTDAQTAAQIEHRGAIRGDREDRREVRRPQVDRRALAQAEPRYRHQAVPVISNCRNIAKLFGWRLDDESDIDQANKFIANCMSGRIPR